MSIREDLIKNYISDVNFSKNWSCKKIEEDIKKMIGETPAIDVTYKTDTMVHELLGEAIEIKVLDKISVLFYDDNNKIKKLEFLIK